MTLRVTGMLLIACCHSVQAQDSLPAAGHEFEVASIRLNTDGNPTKNIGMGGGRRSG